MRDDLKKAAKLNPARKLFDRPRSQGNMRLREFLRQERDGGLHPSVQALHARHTCREASGRKLAEYARVERGHLV
ncbi:MAG: hypothetical protein P3W94_002645 [Paracoccus sp. (in: a-proteobacteria)]|nr:hypothetical protein [Paracoccus sp. (in: a-proteobacteria)]